MPAAVIRSMFETRSHGEPVEEGSGSVEPSLESGSMYDVGCGPQRPPCGAPQLTQLEAACHVESLTLKDTSSVLVVESDPERQNALARFISSRGHRVVGTDSAVGAQSICATWAVDLILVAEDLVGLDGGTLAAELSERCPTAQVVLMLGAGRARSSRRVAGASNRLPKPFRLGRMAGLLDAMLGKPRTAAGSRTPLAKALDAGGDQLAEAG